MTLSYDVFLEMIERIIKRVGFSVFFSVVYSFHSCGDESAPLGCAPNFQGCKISERRAGMSVSATEGARWSHTRDAKDKGRILNVGQKSLN